MKIKEGKYLSKKENKIVWIYPAQWTYECECCGKMLKKGHAWHLVFDDDEQGLEYTYGGTCINNRFNLEPLEE